ncbi:MAG: NAD(P)H-hydrate dehydratase [Firmicutes bacterium]|nr:NAD(P)H-hydrate dehydratase [Bacillota bacterium]
MWLVTAAEMRGLDARTINDYGIPGMVLMEAAGLGVAERIRALGTGPNLTVVAGKGNNGGDGFVVARRLCQEKNVTVFTVAPDEEYGGDALQNLQILRRLKLPVLCLRTEEGRKAFAVELARSDLIVDALFGTGLSRELDTYYKDIITAINGSPALVVAVDIPSGINADTGQSMGAAVRAVETVTFALPKNGHYLYPGAGCTGRLTVVDIGIPQELYAGLKNCVLTPAVVRPLLVDRPADSHKGTFGSVLLVAGSAGMSGAAVLAARAALRGGCGLLYAAVPACIRTVLAAQVPEAITVALPEAAEGSLLPESAALLQERWATCHAVAVGPGWTQATELQSLLNDIITECPLPLVIDADGLNLLAGMPDALARRTAPVVLTPHPGEAARLLGVKTKDIQADRFGSARRLARRFHATVVLKGAHTVVAEPDGTIAVNTTGNSGLATAGSGDVLTGLLAALLAQGLDTASAARLAVFLHGLAGDLAAAEVGERSLLAGDVVNYLSQAYLALQENTL